LFGRYNLSAPVKDGGHNGACSTRHTGGRSKHAELDHRRAGQRDCMKAGKCEVLNCHDRQGGVAKAGLHCGKDRVETRAFKRDPPFPSRPVQSPASHLAKNTGPQKV
jgi:hypothetical protein